MIEIPWTTVTVEVCGQRARLPSFLPLKGWEVDRWRKGYLRYRSRKKDSSIKMGQRAHRAVVEAMLGRQLLVTEQIHHQDFDKLNCCPCNLVIVPASLNPSHSARDPKTGRWAKRGSA